MNVAHRWNAQPLVLAARSSPAGGCGGGPATPTAATAHGPIKIWYSNNAEEVAWGKQMVDGLERRAPRPEDHRPGDPDREELRGGHRRGDHRRQRAVPDLQHRAGRGAAVPEAGRPGRRSTTSPDGSRLHRGAHRAKLAEQYKSPDGKYYQMPWKSNPVMIFYNKKIFAKAGLDPEQPAAGDLRRVPGHRQEGGRQRRRQVRDLAGADQRVLPVLVRLLPAVRRRDRRQAAGRGRQGAVHRRDGQAVADFWRTMYADKLAAQGDVQRRRVRRRQGGDGDRRPVGDRGLHEQGRLGRRPGADPAGHARRARSTPSATPRTSAMYSSCKNRGTAWDVLKFATSKDQDGKLLAATGQMPMRTDLAATYADYFAKNPAVHRLRRPGHAHRRGAQRAELDRRSGRPSATPTPSR